MCNNNTALSSVLVKDSGTSGYISIRYISIHKQLKSLLTNGTENTTAFN